MMHRSASILLLLPGLFLSRSHSSILSDSIAFCSYQTNSLVVVGDYRLVELIL